VDDLAGRAREPVGEQGHAGPGRRLGIGEVPPDRGPRRPHIFELVEALGPELLVHFTLSARRILPEDADSEDSLDEQTPEGSVPAMTLAEGIAKASPRVTIEAGQDLTLAVDLEQLHFFDLQSGLAIR